MQRREDEWARAMRAGRSGDSAAYGEFLRDFAASMRRVVGSQLRRLGFAGHEAEDVVQEILIAVDTKRDQWDDARPLLPWLNAIARYKTIDALRRLRREMASRVDLSDREWAAMFAAVEADAGFGPSDAEKLLAELSPGQTWSASSG